MPEEKPDSLKIIVEKKSKQKAENQFFRYTRHSHEIRLPKP
jgi:hypothetical protein